LGRVKGGAISEKQIRGKKLENNQILLKKMRIEEFH